jgi:GT2 family glycosyltransferase
MPYVFLLNNDTTIEKDCILNLYKAVSEDKRIFSAGALMLSMDNPDIIDNAGDSYNLLGYARSKESGKSRFNTKFSANRPVFSSCAGAAMYNRDTLRALGPFDDRHFAYLEDVDMGYRARIYGYKNVNAASSVVYHKGSAASGSKHNAFKVSNSSRNAVYVAMKNQPALQYICNFPFLALGVLIKTLFFMRKGLVKEYVKGTFNGVKNSLSKEGFAHHVPFKLRYIPNYFKIQLTIIGSTLFFK